MGAALRGSEFRTLVSKFRRLEGGHSSEPPASVAGIVGNTRSQPRPYFDQARRVISVERRGGVWSLDKPGGLEHDGRRS